MLLQSVQDLAQVIADEGVSTSGVVTIALIMTTFILILIDRIVFMLKAWGVIPSKKSNPNGAEKIKEIHEWYVPKNVGEKPPCMNWLPIEEFMEHQKESTELLKKILEIQEEHR